MYLIQQNITNPYIDIYIGRDVHQEKEIKQNILREVTQARTWYLNKQLENRQPFLLNDDTKSFVSNSNHRLQESMAPINDLLRRKINNCHIQTA